MHAMHRTMEPSKRDKMVSSDGVLVEYLFVDNGKKSTIAPVNGWGATFDYWINQTRIRDYNLLFHNGPGMGESELGSGEYLHHCARSLRELCLKLGITEVDVVGHSMGGLVATLFFNEYKDGIEVKTMTLVSSIAGDPIRTFPYRKLLIVNPDKIAASLADGVLGDLAAIIERSRLTERAAYVMARAIGIKLDERSFSKLYHNYLRDSSRKAIMTAFRAMREDGETIGESMSRIDAPTLVTGSKNDVLVCPEAAIRIHERIGGSRIHIFEDGNHAPMFQKPREFNRLLLDFLAQHHANGVG